MQNLKPSLLKENKFLYPVLMQVNDVVKSCRLDWFLILETLCVAACTVRVQLGRLGSSVACVHVCLFGSN